MAAIIDDPVAVRTLFSEYVVAAIVLVLIPGQGMLLCVASGTVGGPRGGYGAAMGTATGEAVDLAASAVGQTTIVRVALTALAWLLHAIGAVVFIAALGTNTLRPLGRPHRRAPAHHALYAWARDRPAEFQDGTVRVRRPMAAGAVAD